MNIIQLLVLFIGLPALMIWLIVRAVKKEAARKAWLTPQQRQGEETARLAQMEAERQKYKIVETCIVENHEKMKPGSSMARGLIGGAVAGTPGAVLGAMSGKTTAYTTFAIRWGDGHVTTEQVKNNSKRYKQLIQCL